MKKFIYLLAALFVVTACTVEKTDYEAETTITVPDNQEFKEVFSIEKTPYKISVEALQGHLYQGYNEVRLRIFQTDANQVVEEAKATFLPFLTLSQGSKESCPNLYELAYQKQGQYYKGYTVFTKTSKEGTWQVLIQLELQGQKIELTQTILIEEQSNKNLNMTSFIGQDQEEYSIALVAPMQPKVAENALVAGIFKKNKTAVTLDQAYQMVDDYTLYLDPRMPEPSMGNHSSPNNRNLIQKEDGFYHGVVNYTMTGNWTLNFILQNQQGRILKGTKVPLDFTPGIEGVKSELYLDILF
ncbi:FixH family protein [Myroides fluvii]|uniref:FixH family protein n=1 Tax=Myroides fluvii TaxID=2572594 RepID=UPI00131B1A9E|nr:FixH family protein [Myroides fluvii]